MNLHESVYLAQGAVVMGDVTMGPGSSVWPNAVIRGDEISIVIGARSNVQDCAVVHGGEGHSVNIGDDVTVGHGAIVHGCTVGNGALIGMGAIVLNGAKVGAGALVAAGALVPEGMEVPAGMVAMGNPAKIRRPLRESEQEYLIRAAHEYVEMAEKNRNS